MSKLTPRARAEFAIKAGAVNSDLLRALLDELSALHAAPEGARFRELATQAAVEAHIEAIRQSQDYLGHVDDMAEATANSLGFQTCPHPDCVLMRSTPAPVVAEGALRALVERWRDEVEGDVPDRVHSAVRECADELAALLPARPASVRET